MNVRLADPSEHPEIESVVIESFEPVSWYKKQEARLGLLNGKDWKTRWHKRMQDIFANEMVLVGESEGRIAAISANTLDAETALAFVDVLAVRQQFQGRGFGRAMLRGTMEYMRGLGAQYINLDCLTDNEKGNSLYQAEGFEEVARQIRWFRKL